MLDPTADASPADVVVDSRRHSPEFTAAFAAWLTAATKPTAKTRQPIPVLADVEAA